MQPDNQQPVRNSPAEEPQRAQQITPTSDPSRPVGRLSSRSSSSGHDGLKMVMSTLGLILAAFFIAFIVMFFVFRSYQVDGPSMEPTLHNGDRLIIWKMPRTWARVTRHSYIPNRGDVIVFVERGLIASDGSPKQLIKRVIGVPGDRVLIENGTVKVFNKEHPNGFTPDTSLPYGDGLSLQIASNEYVNKTIGKGQVYVMGDNRGNSLDSRVFGPIDANDIVGKLVLRMFPLGDAEKF